MLAVAGDARSLGCVLLLCVWGACERVFLFNVLCVSFNSDAAAQPHQTCAEMWLGRLSTFETMCTHLSRPLPVPRARPASSSVRTCQCAGRRNDRNVFTMPIAPAVSVSGGPVMRIQWYEGENSKTSGVIFRDQNTSHALSASAQSNYTRYLYSDDPLWRRGPHTPFYTPKR